MRVYFDVSTLDPNKITGIGVYIIQVLRHLQRDNTIEVVPVLKISRLKRKKYLESFLGQPVKPLWPWVGFFEKDCLYHGPDFRVNIGSHIPRVVTIHDLMVLEKKYCNPKFLKEGILQLTNVLKNPPDVILTVSQFTKSEITKRFPHLEQRTHVTLLGCNRINKSASNIKSDIHTDYILYLGTLEKRKNVLGVIKSFEMLCELGRMENLVLAGAWGFGAEDIQKAITEFPYKNRIIHLNYIDDEKVQGLFKKARVFVFPSWYEGFGIPVIEAMSMGCPVVTSSGGALEEITRDAALHSSPDCPEQIASQVLLILTNKKLRDDLIKRGLEKSAQYTWQKCYEQTRAEYKKLVSTRC